MKKKERRRKKEKKISRLRVVIKQQNLLPAACYLLLAFFSFSFTACTRNPLTGQKTMAFVDNRFLFPITFLQYDQFISENTVITGTPEAEMVKRAGDRIKQAAENWLAAEGHADYLNDYSWEYHLVQSDEVNAWAMPGGKIVVYTGILPLTVDEDGLAVIMGHEVAHILLNHGQQRMSADLLRELGRLGVAIGAAAMELPAETTDLILIAYGVGSQLGGILPFSRAHENEADYYGLILMTLAGYNPEAASSFWSRMAELGDNGFEWLSTHPSSDNRAAQLKDWIPEAEEKAASFILYP